MWAPAEIKILTANASPLVWLVRQAKALAWPLAFQGRGQTLHIKKTHAGLQYFVFEGMRFIVTDGKLYRASLTAGSCYMDFHQACKGLDAAEAGKRLDLLGSNAVPYKATSWISLFVDECFRLFHVYQYIMYTLSMWNSYLFVASLDVFIVLLAGLISIVSARRSQKAIEKVTKLETTAEVVRGSQWQVVPSAQLVPGDVIRVHSNWLLPCDCVVVQGHECLMHDRLPCLPPPYSIPTVSMLPTSTLPQPQSLSVPLPVPLPLLYPYPCPPLSKGVPYLCPHLYSYPYPYLYPTPTPICTPNPARTPTSTPPPAPAPQSGCPTPTPTSAPTSTPISIPTPTHAPTSPLSLPPTLFLSLPLPLPLPLLPSRGPLPLLLSLLLSLQALPLPLPLPLPPPPLQAQPYPYPYPYPYI
ncbi:TPA: hypothetical protein ACH3X1_008116 [Trebouxia sp. C0004]